MAQAFDENPRRGDIAPSQGEIENEFRASIDPDEAVGITDGIVVRFFRAFVRFLPSPRLWATRAGRDPGGAVRTLPPGSTTDPRNRNHRQDRRA